MKTAVVYYSMSGNTQMVAELIAKQLNGDLIRIEPKKAYPDKGAKKFIWGGKSSVMGEKPELLPYAFDLEQYEQIVIGTPIWASNMAPPIRTFIAENKGISKKKIAVFMCFSGGGADKALSRIKELIGVSQFQADLVLIDPLTKNDANKEEKIVEFCKCICISKKQHNENP